MCCVIKGKKEKEKMALQRGFKKRRYQKDQKYVRVCRLINKQSVVGRNEIEIQKQKMKEFVCLRRT